MTGTTPAGARWFGRWWRWRGNFTCAVVILHHVRKSDGVYRGGTEIAAAVDALFEISRPGKDAPDQTVRLVRGRGRWAIEPFAYRLNDQDQIELAGGAELSLDARALLYVEQHPGSSKRAIRDAVKGRARAVDEALNRLVSRGAVQHGPGGFRADREHGAFGMTPRSCYHVSRPRVPPFWKMPEKRVPRHRVRLCPATTYSIARPLPCPTPCHVGTRGGHGGQPFGAKW